MVVWNGNPTMAGYDPTTHQYGPAVYQFATSGTAVDVQAITRLGYLLPGTYASDPLYLNRLNVQASVTFSSADFTANPGKYLSLALYVVADSFFPDGHIPTMSEMVEGARDKNGGSVFRARNYAFGPGPVTLTTAFWGPVKGGVPFNTKYWIMVVPTALTNPDSTWNVSNDPPMAGVTLDSFARALSFSGNRTPAAPTITSPASGAVVAPGASFNLAISSNDPDRTGTTDSQKANWDLGGMQVQYAPLPSPATPNPVWTDLEMMSDYDGDPSAFYLAPVNFVVDNARMLEGHARLKVIDNAGLPVICGIQNEYQNTPMGSGVLPAGTWQLRARVTDVGHPYPLLPRTPAGKAVNAEEITVDDWPDVNTSDWSTAVVVNVPSQVPPPILLTPTNELAVEENSTVRLGWQYRNTFVPPKTQNRRIVQIRKVGETDWNTIAYDISQTPYFDLPPVLVQPTPHAAEYVVNGTFETNNVGNWVIPSSATGSPTLTNITTTPPGPRAGSRYLKATPGADPVNDAGFAALRFIGTVDPTHDQFQFTVSFNARDTTDEAITFFAFYWLDVGGNPLIDDAAIGSFVLDEIRTPQNSSAYTDYVSPVITRDGRGFTLAVTAYSYILNEDLTLNKYVPTYIDNASLTGTSSNPPVNYTLEVDTEYEWRASVGDTSNTQSTYATPARFWVVSAAGSGPTRPVVAQTVDGGSLGCGTHTVQIFRRGGKRYVGTLKNVSHVDWGRLRDDISTAKVVVSDWDLDCGNLLANLQSWAYEVVIWRDNGQAKKRVWEGPITLLTYERDKVTIEAKDVMGYAYRRIIKQKMTDTANGDTVVNRAKRIIQNVFAFDDPNVLPYLTVLTKDDDAMQYRSTPAYSRTAYEEIDDMAANSGLDYTCIGRSIMLWGTKHRIGTLPEFTDNDLGAVPIVSEYGMSFANRWVVSDGNGVWGEATRLDVSGNDETYGVVEVLSSSWASDSPEDSGTYTQAGLQKVIQSFSGFAERSISDRYPPPVVVRVPDNTTLNPQTLIDIQQLVPGVVIPLRSSGTLRAVVASQKLDSITVTEENGKETITVVMSPFSRDDVAAEETA